MTIILFAIFVQMIMFYHTIRIYANDGRVGVLLRNYIQVVREIRISGRSFEHVELSLKMWEVENKFVQ